MGCIDETAIRIIDECLKQLFHSKTLPTIDLIGELSGLNTKEIVDAITWQKNQFIPKTMAITSLSLDDIDVWLNQKYLMKIAYKFKYLKKTEHGEKIEVLCENCGLTIDELHEYVYKYPINKNEYYILRGAIRNYLERKENTNKKEANAQSSIAAAENSRVKVSKDVFDFIMHALRAGNTRFVNEKQKQADKKQHKKMNNRLNKVINDNDFSFDSLFEDDDDFDLDSWFEDVDSTPNDLFGKDNKDLK